MQLPRLREKTNKQKMYKCEKNISQRFNSKVTYLQKTHPGMIINDEISHSSIPEEIHLLTFFRD